MCGIAGLVTSRARLDPKHFECVLQTIRHRGPDGEGILAYDSRSKRAKQLAGCDTASELGFPRAASVKPGEFDVLLGHRRLSIIDLSLHGHQPMPYLDRYWLDFNGEVYNYIELREELKEFGYSFETACDTEVVLAAYDRWGPEMLSRFVGMFAFVILDTQERTLFVARDPFGIKPLYYSVEGNQFAFASELKALLAIPGVSREANIQRVSDFLALGLSDIGDTTFFRDIKSLEAAHFLTVDLESRKVSEPTRYWSLRLDKKSTLTFKQAAEELQARFLDNVRLHMRSDVEVGACLSGGIDSSAIVMAMRKVGGPSLDIHAFTYIAESEDISEERWADEIAAAAGAIHHKVKPGVSDLVEDFSDFVALQDEPFGSTSIYAQYRVFKMAHEAGIKVMLDGQGADEMLGGYLHYLSYRVASAMYRGNIPSAISLMTAGTRDRGPFRKSVPIESAFYCLPSSLRRAIRLRQKSAPAWINHHWFANHGVTVKPIPTVGGANAFKRALLESVEVRGLQSLLRYEDRNSMVASIESRVPFLTTSLAEFLFSLPDEYLIDSKGNTKCVFREAMRGIVPDAILDRRDKIGFRTPEREWFRKLSPWVDQSLANADSSRAPFLVPDVARREFARILDDSGHYKSTTWRWLNALRWSELLDVSFAD